MGKLVLLGALAGVLIGTAGLATPASGHAAGGQLQLYLQVIHVETTESGFAVNVHLADRDSGAPATGFGTTVEGTGPGGQVLPATVLIAGSNGEYRGIVNVPPGRWALTIRSKPVPGSDDAVPLIVNRTLSFGGQGVTHHSAAAHEGGSSIGAPVALIAVLALIGGAMSLLVARRRRSRLAGARA